jgi:hypothetical protein
MTFIWDYFAFLFRFFWAPVLDVAFLVRGFLENYETPVKEMRRINVKMQDNVSMVGHVPPVPFPPIVPTTMVGLFY